jgi:tripartite-type tricarboxylate transporter receptor subunit TctC
MMRRLACAVATLIAGAMPASAQTFPTHSVTIVVPYVAGGPTDAAARIVGEHMAATLGQHVLIENVSGGSGNIATARVARASPATRCCSSNGHHQHHQSVSSVLTVTGNVRV